MDSSLIQAIILSDIIIFIYRWTTLFVVVILLSHNLSCIMHLDCICWIVSLSCSGEKNITPTNLWLHRVPYPLHDHGICLIPHAKSRIIFTQLYTPIYWLNSSLSFPNHFQHLWSNQIICTIQLKQFLKIWYSLDDGDKLQMFEIEMPKIIYDVSNMIGERKLKKRKKMETKKEGTTIDG